LVPTVDAGPGRDAGGGDVERLGVVVARRRALDRAGAQAATGERRPDRAGVLTAERLRGRDDAVAPGDEAGAAALDLQALGDVLQRAGVARGVPPGVEVGLEAVLVDEVPGHVPEGRGPGVPDAVRRGEGAAVQPPARLDPVVGERLDRHVLA